MRIRYRKHEAPADTAAADLKAELELPIRPLGERQLEQLLPQGSRLPTSPASPVQAYESDGMQVLVVRASIDAPDAQQAGSSTYSALLEAAKDLHLVRIWNFLPEINEGEGDEEIYRQFCVGRSLAFSEHFGEETEVNIPAGTCVGCDGRELFVIALASRQVPQHYENPRQVPAYRYPREYGPKSPSFARASSITLGSTYYRFIAGTASVIGHESIGVDDLQKQLQITFENLDLIAKTALGEANIASDSRSEVTGKVYLRRAADYATVKAALEKQVPQWTGKLIYLRSDICRKDLLLEIDLTFKDQLA